MKCKNCSACHKGYFKSKPDDYVCTGVYEPFVIENIDKECTEYPEKNKENTQLKVSFNGGLRKENICLRRFYKRLVN